MKKIYTLLAIVAITFTAQAQSFEYSLTYLGLNDAGTNYEVALMATPDFTETNGNSADMGTVVSMSTNVFVGTFVNDCTTQSVPPFATICEYPIEKDEWAANYLAGPSTVSGRTVFSLERTETGESTFFDAASSTPVILAVFEISNTVAGLPTSGDITLVENGDTILNGTPNGSYFNIKYATATGNITTDMYGSQNASANSVNFATLSTTEAAFEGVSIYPNPVKDVLNIRGVENLTRVEVLNINGQVVNTFDSNLEAVNMSNFTTGIYFAKLTTANASKTIKIIKE